MSYFKEVVRGEGLGSDQTLPPLSRVTTCSVLWFDGEAAPAVKSKDFLWAGKPLTVKSCYVDSLYIEIVPKYDIHFHSTKAKRGDWELFS